VSARPSDPVTFVNGEFLPEEEARISPLDRGFLYGDGVFETIRVRNGRRFLWERHLSRLKLGATFLRFDERAFRETERVAEAILIGNQVKDGFLRIHVSRGQGERGYSPRGANHPTVVMTTHVGLPEVPERLRLMTSKFRVLADEAWTQLKTTNRLQNILARQEADETGLDEALMLNHRWSIAGASAANVFCVQGEMLLTPPLAAGGVAGTTRAFLIDSAKELGVEVREQEIGLEDFHQSDAAFLTSAGLLVAAVESLDSKAKNWTHPLIGKLRSMCEEAGE
jgi:branched-chain amino acid aminotransferase